jgi:hypothetical protein
MTQRTRIAVVPTGAVAAGGCHRVPGAGDAGEMLTIVIRADDESCAKEALRRAEPFVVR